MSGDAPLFLVFFHLEKCGGSSVTRFLVDNLPAAMRIDYAEAFLQVDREVLAATPRVLAYGHGAWGVGDLAPGRECRYITMLRDPFQRMKSDYAFNKARGTFHDDFDAYATPRANFLCWRLADNDLDRAKRRLEKEYDSFGLTEEFERTLRIWAHRYGFSELDYSHENRSLRDGSDDQAAYDRFAAQNGPDLELYRFARELFEARWREVEGPASAVDLRLLGHTIQEHLSPEQRSGAEKKEIASASSLSLIAAAEFERKHQEDPDRGVEAAWGYYQATGYPGHYEHTLASFGRWRDLYTFAAERLRALAELPWTPIDGTVNVRRRSIFLHMLTCLTHDPLLFAETLWAPLAPRARRVALLGAGRDAQILVARLSGHGPEIVVLTEAVLAEEGPPVSGRRQIDLSRVEPGSVDAVVVVARWKTPCEILRAEAQRVLGLPTFVLYAPLWEMFPPFERLDALPPATPA